MCLCYSFDLTELFSTISEISKNLDIDSLSQMCDDEVAETLAMLA